MGKTKGAGTLFKIMATTPVTVGNITNITPPNPTRETIDATTLSSPDNCREFDVGWIDAGEVNVSGYYDPSTGGGQAELEALLYSGEKETFDVVYPTGIGKTLSFDGFVTSVAPAVELEGYIAWECTIKVTGKPTMATTA